tara:strand:- start:775 stop:1020 length:246 start_codon:yes stop_codon:yes gene_type:complete
MEKEKENISPADRMYQNHLLNVSRYQKKNKEKMQLKCKQYNEKIKKECPEKYQIMLEKKREYYHNITKPKKLLKENKIIDK